MPLFLRFYIYFCLFSIVGQGATPASRVILTGSFFDWNPTGRQLVYQPPVPTSPVKDGSGVPVGDASAILADSATALAQGYFETHLRLPVGNHTFKCVTAVRRVCS